VAVGRRQVRLQIAHVIRDLVVRHRCLLRRPTAAPQAAPQACQDNVPHLLAGVVYTGLTTGKAREAGVSGPAVHMANSHHLDLSSGIVVAILEDW
jgi:hypothetical protein